MGLRSPTGEIQIPNLDHLHALKWHTLECELVTPMYGGGVEAATIDLKMPIRVSAIKGQLRFWWRLLAKHKWKLGNSKAIQNAEFALWGGMGDDDGGRASQVFLKVKNVSKPKLERWAEYRPNARGRDTLYPERWANVPYALFPAQGRTQENPLEEPHELLREGLKWDLQVAFSAQITDEQKMQFWQTLKWWSSFGGVGARTRRGLGAVLVEDSVGEIFKVSKEEAISIGCQICSKPANNAYSAWEHSVNKLQAFRQIGEGRKSYDTRSKWSEPDAIRFHTKQSLPRHSERLTLGNIFPRAAFGLPIIFKFKDEGRTSNNDPIKTTLNIKRNTTDGLELLRFSSPLILRPYLNDMGNWESMALCLPNTLLDILERDNSLELRLNDYKVVHWDKEKAIDGEFKHEVRQFEKSYDNQQAEQISLMV